MRKRSTQEILEATVTSSTTRQKRIDQEKRRKALEKVAQQRSADQNKKPDLKTILSGIITISGGIKISLSL